MLLTIEEFYLIWITFVKIEDFEVGLEANKLFNRFHFDFFFFWQSICCFMLVRNTQWKIVTPSTLQR